MLRRKTVDQKGKEKGIPRRVKGGVCIRRVRRRSNDSASTKERRNTNSREIKGKGVSQTNMHRTRGRPSNSPSDEGAVVARVRT